MLKSWSLQNFKPIRDLDELQLAPVTMLAGRNSSGKSSLIQSILMIAQTLSSRVLDRPLLPHGPFAHLGTFEDILNKYSNIQSLTVGFQLEIEEELIVSENRTAERSIRRFGIQQNINSVKVISQFFGAEFDSPTSSAIEASKVSVEKVSLQVSSSAGMYDQPFEFGINIRKLTDEELGIFINDVATEYLRLVPYSIKETNYLGTFQAKHYERPDQSLVALSHFLPTRLIYKFKIEERRLQRLKRIISRSFTFNNYFTYYIEEISDLFDPDAPIVSSLRQDILKLCKGENITDLFVGQSLRELVNWYKALKLGRGRKKSAFGTKIQKLVLHSLMDQTGQSLDTNEKTSEALETMSNNFYVDNLEEAVEQITRFFTSKIRYLGPLRADPEIIQGFSPSSELDDVGSKGQYAATVYDANQNASIAWYNPISQEVEQGTLRIALNAWARHLGVAHEIQIEIAGQSGVSWQVVHLEGHKPLPLTAVGVGVSQILPILVMGLLSSSGTLLLVEQPELHLHPKVQALLGDFFVGLAKCGKQCLIETHSENLVSQLRYHIVQAGGMEKSDCMIYFVDQDELGSAKFETVEISEKGNILNWPEGFFDETILQEGRIATEWMRKKAKQASNG